MRWLNTHCTPLEWLHSTSTAIVWTINNQTQHLFPCRKMSNEESLIEYWVKEGMGRKSGTHNQGTITQDQSHKEEMEKPVQIIGSKIRC